MHRINFRRINFDRICFDFASRLRNNLRFWHFSTRLGQSSAKRYWSQAPYVGNASQYICICGHVLSDDIRQHAFGNHMPQGTL
mmetsp:Transcript_53187/g.161563  ORF Transcript_53187/g.161563 Transcript_53187/m.161563 type:complete len:83 (+) Transcript_53187:770-1018(+)